MRLNCKLVMLRRRLTWLIPAASLAACSALQQAPLPPIETPPPPSDLAAPRIFASAGQLAHPPLPPVKVNLADGLDPDEAAVLAVLLDPDLVSLRDQHGIGEAQVVNAGILPNPVFAAALDHPYGTGSAGDSNLIDLSLSLGTRSFLARSAKRSAAHAELDQIDLGIAWQEWQVAENARLLTVRLGWLGRRLDLASQELAFEEKTARTLEAASQAGDVTLGQVGVQRAALESVRRTVIDLEQARTNAESDLLALLGEPRQGHLQITPPPEPDAIPQADSDQLAGCLGQRLDLLALRRGYDAQQARIRQAVLEQFPDISVGIHYQRNEVALNFIGGFLNFELPIFNRNQGNLAIGQASRTQLRDEYDARVAAVRAAWVRLLRLSALLRKQLPEVRASLGPLEKIEAAERVAVAHGDVDRLSYQTVRTALVDLRLQQANLSQALAETEVGLETTCGGPLHAQR